MQQRLRCNNIDLTIQNIHNNGIGENSGIQCIQVDFIWRFYPVLLKPFI